MHPNLGVAAGQGDAGVVVNPLQVEDAVDESTVVGHHLRLLDAPAPTQANFAPLHRLADLSAARTVVDAPPPIRLPPPDRPVVVSLDPRLDSSVENHDQARLGAQGYEMPAPRLFTELEVVGGGVLGAREGPRARQPQDEVRQVVGCPKLAIPSRRSSSSWPRACWEKQSTRWRRNTLCPIILACMYMSHVTCHTLQTGKVLRYVTREYYSHFALRMYHTSKILPGKD